MKFFCILLFSAVVWITGTGMAQAQDNTPPDRPMITYVTVDTATNNTLIYWSESNAADLAWYYLYYEINTVNGPEGVKFDSVAPGNSSYTHITNASAEPIIYSISAIDSAGNESVRTPGFHSTIQVKLEYDSCFDAINVIWNKYTGWGNNISGYRIYARTFSGSYGSPVGVTKEDSLYRFTNIGSNTLYFFFVEAIKNDNRVSRSALASRYTYMPGPPDNFTLVDVDALSPDLVQINFEYTDTSNINDFRLLRSNSQTADFVNVSSRFNLAAGLNFFQDTIVTGSDRYYYRIGALNPCSKVISTTNIGRNIVLSGSNDDYENTLLWNKYEDWDSGVEEYRVMSFNPDGSSFIIHSAGPFVTQYTHDFRDYYGAGFEGIIQYRIEAKKAGEEVFSLSNVLELDIATSITVPNAFTPNNDGRNDSFKPVFTLLPSSYLMLIYDRYGIVVFKTESPTEGWDGRINGGEMATEGVYVYHIQYTSYTGTSREVTGHLTLFYP